MLFSKEIGETFPLHPSSFGLKCRPGVGAGLCMGPYPEPCFLALHWERAVLGELSHGPHGAAASLPLFEKPFQVWLFFFFFFF